VIVTIKELYDTIGIIFKENKSNFEDTILQNISIDKPLEKDVKWGNSFYEGTTKFNDKNYKLNLKISNKVIDIFLEKNGESFSNACYDITLQEISTTSIGNITLIVKDIKETGLSSREVLKRRLERFSKTFIEGKNYSYFSRPKKEFPFLISSILAITSKNSDIHNDLTTNLNLKYGQLTIKYCATSQEIAGYIDNHFTYGNFSIIVLYRGGHEDEAMSLFSHEDIIKVIDNSTIPVCAALGHDIDKPFIYHIVDKTFSTPSAFAKEIASYNKNRIDIIKENITLCQTLTKTMIEFKIDSLNCIEKTIHDIIVSLIGLKEEKYQTFLNTIKDKVLLLKEKYKTYNEYQKKLKKEQQQKNVLYFIIFILISGFIWMILQ